MVFSSLIFVFLFLPFVLTGNFLLSFSKKWQNSFLMGVSLVFYAWGEPRFVIIMMASIIWNWGMALWMDSCQRESVRNAILGIALTGDTGILLVFKYLNFLSTIASRLLNTELSVLQLPLPIGISFFTFQGLSYVIDVWRRDAKAEKNMVNVGLYISFFPQLIAGPIVRYLDIKEELANRMCTWRDMETGIARFLTGFSKKVLLANNLAFFADQAFSLNAEPGGVNTIFAWGGILAYTLQIYYDFGGYSDMALGLGNMFGFHFRENFDYPYASSSVSEFWRRWHMSLSGWFRDYIYIPLGGNRVGVWKQMRNLMVVWFLTGLWHGADYTFIIWGLFYWCIIIAEKLTGVPQNIKGKAGKRIYRLATILAVMSAWVVFRAESMVLAMRFLRNMYVWSGWEGTGLALFYLREYKWFLIAGVLLAFPMVPQEMKEKRIVMGIQSISLLVLFLVSLSYLAKGSYNPFIYFNF